MSPNEDVIDPGDTLADPERRAGRVVEFDRQRRDDQRADDLLSDYGTAARLSWRLEDDQC